MSSAEKTEKPTPKKLREAREKGQVAFSRDASSVAVFMVGMLTLFATATMVSSAFSRLYGQTMQLVAHDQLLPGALLALVRDALSTILLLALPLLTAVVVIALAVGFMQTRFNLSAHPLKPELEKVNPLKKLKQWFGIQGLFEFSKTLFKLFVVFLVAYLVVFLSREVLLRLGLVDAPVMFTVAASLGKRFLVNIAIVFLIVAAGDAVFQRWKYERDQRMTKDEVKREFKNTEGDPQIKGQRKQIHRELSQQEINRTVAEADAVVVNPTHYAVVLRYERGEMAAPEVSLKGVDTMAQRIIACAKSHRTPVLRDIKLARGLYAAVEVGDLIPSSYYAAVAEVLKFVYRLQQREEKKTRWWRS